MHTKKIEPVRKEQLIMVSRVRAFGLFTEKIDDWWPKQSSSRKAAPKKMVLECRDGGRWYEIGFDDSQFTWGKVLIWSPPHKLVLAWQINSEFKYDPNLVTEVEINFIEEGPKVTRVTLEHRNIEKVGDKAHEFWTSVDGGWRQGLDSLQKLAENL